MLEQLNKVDGLIAALEMKERGEPVSEEVLAEAHALARAYAEGKLTAYSWQPKLTGHSEGDEQLG